MGQLAVDHIASNSEAAVERYTVPGFLEAPLAAQRLIDEHGCDVVIVCSMVNSHDMNKEYAQRATEGFLRVALDNDAHVLEAAVGKDEAKTKRDLVPIIEDRVLGHVENALALLEGRDALRSEAGTGRRQGGDDAGRLGEGTG